MQPLTVVVVAPWASYCPPLAQNATPVAQNAAPDRCCCSPLGTILPPCWLRMRILWLRMRLLGPGEGLADFFWISLAASLVFGALWGPLWMRLGPFWSSFQVFRNPMASYFLNFNHIFDFTYRRIFKFRLLYIIFLFCVAVCEETWSAKLPKGSIFML